MGGLSRCRFRWVDFSSSGISVKGVAAYFGQFVVLWYTVHCELVSSIYHRLIMVGERHGVQGYRNLTNLCPPSIMPVVGVFPSWVTHSSGFVPSAWLILIYVAHPLRQKERFARLKDFGSLKLTLDFGFFLMRKLGDETCWRALQNCDFER